MRTKAWRASLRIRGRKAVKRLWSWARASGASGKVVIRDLQDVDSPRRRGDPVTGNGETGIAPAQAAGGEQARGDCEGRLRRGGLIRRGKRFGAERWVGGRAGLGW